MNYLRSLYNYLYNLNYAYVLVLALMVKALVSDVSYATFLLTVPVLAFEGYKIYLKTKEPDPVKIDEAIMKELDALKSKLNAQEMTRNVKNPGARW